jgi:CDP-4-dehydro-6-deoxyglucose reductase, E3
MPLITTSFGKTFAQADGQTLLDAAAQAGLTLPYSCKTGRCSTCKCKVLSGQSQALGAETGLSAAESEAGWVLSCVRSARSDLLIEAEDLGDLVLPPVQIQPARIHSLARLAPDVLQLRLRLPPSSTWQHLPGQYVDVIAPGGLQRSYSLANAPQADKQLELHIRAVQGGAMSHYWFHTAQVNDLLRLKGPLGSFFLRPLQGLHLVFLATGTGIAPVKAMLHALAQAPAAAQPLSVTLYWGGRQPHDLYTDPQPWHPALRHVPVLSRADAHWPGARGHVHKAWLNAAPDLAHSVVYACGSDAMIHSAKMSALQAGLSASRFYSDAFVCSAAP